jgi:hypothetical protein
MKLNLALPPLAAVLATPVTETASAAVIPPLPRFDESELEEWKRVFDYEIKGLYDASLTNSNKMTSNEDYHRILNIVSNPSDDKFDTYKYDYQKREFETKEIIEDTEITRRKVVLFRNAEKGKKGKKLKSGTTNPRKEFIAREVIPIEKQFDVIR